MLNARKYCTDFVSRSPLERLLADVVLSYMYSRRHLQTRFYDKTTSVNSANRAKRQVATVTFESESSTAEANSPLPITMISLAFSLPTSASFTGKPIANSRAKNVLSPISTRVHQCPERKTKPVATLSNVMIVAANRGLGAHLTTHLHSQKTTALTTTHRPQTECPEQQQDESTAVHTLDALDRDATHELLKEVRPEILITCVGGDVTDPDELPDLPAAKNLIDAAIEANVSRFVYISALGAGESEPAVPFQVMQTMRPLLLDKTDAEAYLRAKDSPMQWTIVRPAPLTDSGTGQAVVTKDIQCYGTVTREDLAVVIANIAQSEKTVNSTLHVVDRGRVLITSPYVRPLEFWEPLPFNEFTL